MIELTSHAIQRFHERIKPNLDRDQAETELRALLEIAEHVTEKPEWAGHDGFGMPSDCWMVIPDCCALPCRVCRDGHLAVLSCIPPSTFGQHIYERRLARDKKRRRARMARKERGQANRILPPELAA